MAISIHHRAVLQQSKQLKSGSASKVMTAIKNQAVHVGYQGLMWGTTSLSDAPDLKTAISRKLAFDAFELMLSAIAKADISMRTKCTNIGSILYSGAEALTKLFTKK